MKKDHSDDPTLNKENQEALPFKDINPDKEGVTVGGGDTETIEFDNKDMRVVGVLMDIRELTKPYKSKLYEVHNAKGEFSFWGGSILDDRLSKVPMESIVDIIYNGETEVAGGGNSYKNFTVRYYSTPEGFDPTKHSVYLDSGKNLVQIVSKDFEAPDSDIPF